MSLFNAKKIIPYALPYKKYAFSNIFFNVLYALFGTLSFMALIPMLEALFDETPKVLQKPVFDGISSLNINYAKQYLNYYITSYAGDSKTQALTLIIIMVLVLFLLKNVFHYLAVISINHLRNGVLKDLRNVMFQKVLSLPISYFSEKRKGDLMARITGDINEFQNSYLSILELIVREPLSILFSIIAMLALSPKLTLFVFVFIPLSGIIISRIGKSLKKHSNRLQQEQGLFLSIIEESISGLRVVKAFTAEKIFASKFENSTDRMFRQANHLSNRQSLASPISEFLGIAVIGVLLWFGGRMVLVDGTIKGSDFIGYMALAYNILTPAKAISRASYQLRSGAAAADRVMEILSAQNPIVEKENAIVKTDFSSSISIKNIWFKYQEKYVLQDFSLEIPKGKTVALVGQSGSGKSTIANLINRFYDVNKGSISFDGVDIRDMNVASLRRLVGMVSQDSILFNDSVENNLKIGKPNATEQELIQATQVANAYEFVDALPNKFQHHIGDGGNTLSGGQKQRLSIARAVLKNSPIMVLDEATSALDTESEKLVQDALENMMKNRTSIVIAHRLSTIQNADLIVVMEQGKIVEQGSHTELMEKNGTYRRLVEMQSFSE